MRTTFLFVLLAGLPFLLHAQTRHDALLIEGYGATYDIPDADFPVDPERVYMMLFDVLDSPGAPEDLNIKLNTVARFLNMHARAGVPTVTMAYRPPFTKRAKRRLPSACISTQYTPGGRFAMFNAVVVEVAFTRRRRCPAAFHR